MLLIASDLSGGPGRSPTCDLRVRSALLYATELPGLWVVWRQCIAVFVDGAMVNLKMESLCLRYSVDVR